MSYQTTHDYTGIVLKYGEGASGIVAQTKEALKDEREQFLSIFGSINQIIYISDPKTHEILYANDTLKVAFKKDLVGDICYRVFQGLESPCEFCTNEIILKEKYKPYQWEHYNPFLNRDFMLQSKIFNQYGCFYEKSRFNRRR